MRSLKNLTGSLKRVFQLRMQLPDAVLTDVDIYSAKYSLISDAKKHGKLSCPIIFVSTAKINKR